MRFINGLITVFEFGDVVFSVILMFFRVFNILTYISILLEKDVFDVKIDVILMLFWEVFTVYLNKSLVLQFGHVIFDVIFDVILRGF